APPPPTRRTGVTAGSRPQTPAPATPALLARQAVNVGSQKNYARPALEEESARNQEERNWWKDFIFNSFDKNAEVSEKKFLDRFRSECGGRWKFACEGINLDINCCAEGAG